MFVFQVSLNFDPVLHFNEESDYSEEDTSDNKDFRFTILQLFQF